MISVKKDKQCKFCCEDILYEKIICKYCLKDQRNFFRQWINWFSISMFAIAILIYLNIGGVFSKKIEDHIEYFVINQEHITYANNGHDVIVFKVHNQGDIAWGDLNYQLVGYEDDKVIWVKWGDDYTWIVQPHSTSFITISLDNSNPRLSWNLLIKGLKNN